MQAVYKVTQLGSLATEKAALQAFDRHLILVLNKKSSKESRKCWGNAVLK